VDVAREAADLILLEHDLAVVHGGVQEGRRTFGNILKYLLMGTSSNFGNMLSMALGTLMLPFLPLLPVQVLLNNLMYDLSEVPIPLDHVEPSLLERPHRFDIRHLRDFMLIVGAGQLRVRSGHVRHPAVRLPRGRTALPYGLVRRVHGDAGARRARHPHAGRPVPSATASGFTRDRAGGRRARRSCSRGLASVGNSGSCPFRAATSHSSSAW
jgi:hypothetical protein